MDNHKQYEHGIYLGYMNNTSQTKDYHGNDFLKKKTIGLITNKILVGSDDFFHYSDKGPRHYMGIRFSSFREVIRWSINSNSNAKWLVLFEAGTIIDNDRAKVFNLWLNQLPPADNTNVAAYGHILMPKDYSTFDMNTQMIALNLEVMRKHKMAIWNLVEREGKMELFADRAHNDYHDGYTPYWLLPSSNVRTPFVTKRAAWLVHLINSGYSVMNLSEETIRQCKQFFYMDTPEQIELLQHYAHGTPEDALLEKAESIGKKGVMSAFLKEDKAVASEEACLIQNTSTFPYDWGLPKTVDAVVTTCAGLNFVRFAQSVPLSPDAKMYHYDIAGRAVKFREDLIKGWGGTNYFDYACSIRVPGEEQFYLGSKEPFDSVEESTWQTIQGLQHEYFTLDVMELWWKPLVFAKNAGAKTIIFDVSNIFSYTKTTYVHGFDNPVRTYKAIIDFLQENFEEWQFYTDMFSITNRDIAAYDEKPMELVNINGAKTDRSAFGYLVYRAKPIIPIHPIATAWESASVDLSTLMANLDPTRFTRVTRDAVRRTDKTNWNEFYSESYLPAVEMDLPFDHEAFLAEAQATYDKGLFTYHRNEGDTGWCSFVINGLEHGKTKSYESYFPGAKETHDLYQMTPEARENCPTIVKYFEEVFPTLTGVGTFNRVRIMALEPRGVILPHFDSLNSNQPGPVNIALSNPKNCHFHLWKGSNWTEQNYWGYVPFAPGKAFNIDIGNSHMIYNLSDEVRFHMIIHYDLPDEASRRAWNEFRSKSLRKVIRKFK